MAASAARTAETLRAIAFWDAGSPGFRWNQVGAQLFTADPAPDTYRVPTYLNLAIYDATIAAWTSKHTTAAAPEHHPLTDRPYDRTYPPRPPTVSCRRKCLCGQGILLWTASFVAPGRPRPSSRRARDGSTRP